MAVDTRRATEGPADVLMQYVEEPDRAQRSRHGQIRRRSRSGVRNTGWGRPMPRLCYVSGYYNPLTMPTPLRVMEEAETWREFARLLAGEGFQTHVLTLFREDHELQDGPVSWHFVKPGFPWSVLGAALAGLRGDRQAPYYQPGVRLAARLEQLQPDLVHFFGLTLDLALFLVSRRARRQGIPLVVHYHGGQPSSHPLRRLLQKANLQRIDRALFTAPEQAAPWVQAGLSPGQVGECLETSTTFRGFPKPEARRRMEMKGDPVLVSIARLHPIKDPLTVMRAFDAVAHGCATAQLYLYYRSEELISELRHFLASRPALHGRVHFRGAQPHAAMEWVLSGADFLVQGSRREFSGFAVLEAMACGAIPAVPALPPFKVMTEDGRFGILFSPGDWQELARQILASLGEIEQRSLAARRKFERDLSFAALATRLSKLYQDLLLSSALR